MSKNDRARLREELMGAIGPYRDLWGYLNGLQKDEVSGLVCLMVGASFKALQTIADASSAEEFSILLEKSEEVRSLVGITKALLDLDCEGLERVQKNRKVFMAQALINLDDIDSAKALLDQMREL